MTSFWSLYCLLWIYFTACSSVSIVNSEQVNAGWIPLGKYLFKVNIRDTGTMPWPSRNLHTQGHNRITRTMCEICSKLTIKTPEQRQWRLCFHCWLWIRKCLYLNAYICLHLRHFSCVFTVDFERGNAGWGTLR